MRRFAKAGLVLSVLFAVGVVGCGSNKPTKPDENPEKVTKADLIGDWMFSDAVNTRVFLTAESSGKLLLTGFQKFGDIWIKSPVNPMFLVISIGANSPDMADLIEMGPMALMNMDAALTWDIDEDGKNLFITMTVAGEPSIGPVIQVCPFTLTENGSTSTLDAEVAGVKVKLTKNAMSDFEGSNTVYTQSADLMNTIWLSGTPMLNPSVNFLYFNMGLAVGGDLYEILGGDIDFSQILDGNFEGLDIKTWYTEGNSKLVLLDLVKGSCQPFAALGVEDCAYSVTNESEFTYSISTDNVMGQSVSKLTLVDEDGVSETWMSLSTFF
jgi:hypothetical protein